jgi:hypothetical protein
MSEEDCTKLPIASLNKPEIKEKTYIKLSVFFIQYPWTRPSFSHNVSGDKSSPSARETYLLGPLDGANLQLCRRQISSKKQIIEI